MCHSSWVRVPFGRLVIAIMVVMCAAAACGSDGGPAKPSCPNDVPAVCPSVVPSYGTDVAPLIETKCAGCHTPGGMASTWQFRTYDEISSPGLLPDIEFKLSSCMMPPPDQPQPTPAERQAFLAWIVCDAPNN